MAKLRHNIALLSVHRRVAQSRRPTVAHRSTRHITSTLGDVLGTTVFIPHVHNLLAIVHTVAHHEFPVGNFLEFVL